MDKKQYNKKEKGRLKGNFFLFFLATCFAISLVSAFVIICEDENKGFQIWDNNQSYNETGWTIEDMEEYEGMNCSLIDSPFKNERCPEFEPIVNQLNQRLSKNQVEIQALENRQGRYTFYRIFSFLFLIVSIILVFLVKKK